MDLQLQNKIAFISGSTAGIGFAIAKSLLQEGAHVIINGRSQDGVDKAVEELKGLVKNATVSGFPADFSKADEVNRLIEQLPNIDILVNNAGIFEPKTDHIHLQRVCSFYPGRNDSLRDDQNCAVGYKPRPGRTDQGNTGDG